MKKEEKEFFPGERVVIMDIGSGAKKEGIVLSVDSLNLIDPKITVRNSGGKVLFDKEASKGETVFGTCVLMHTKV